MVCDFGGSPTVRHNEVRDLTAELLTEGGAVANRLRRRTSDQTVLGSNPAVAAALSPWTRLYTPSSQGEAFTLASISYLAILVKYILAKKKTKKRSVPLCCSGANAPALVR